MIYPWRNQKIRLNGFQITRSPDHPIDPASVRLISVIGPTMIYVWRNQKIRLHGFQITRSPDHPIYPAWWMFYELVIH